MISRQLVRHYDPYPRLGNPNRDSKSKLNLGNPESKFRYKVCGKEAPNKCSRCQKARYCSKTCQTADWKIHKPYCIAAIMYIDSKSRSQTNLHFGFTGP